MPSPPLPPSSPLKTSHPTAFSLNKCFLPLAPGGLRQMAKLHSQPTLFVWEAHTSDCCKRCRRQQELTQEGHPTVTIQNKPDVFRKATSYKWHLDQHIGTECTSPCLQVLGTIIPRSRSSIYSWLTACQKGMSYHSNKYCFDDEQAENQGRGFWSITSPLLTSSEDNFFRGYGSVLHL